MHRSLLCAIGIDCKTEDLETAADFWSQALGRPVAKKPGVGERYATLGTGKEDLIVFVQAVNHESRVHLDIESDDVDAEVARLEALGAKKVRQVESWWIMEAPTGHRFCVVRAQHQPIPPSANEWL